MKIISVFTIVLMGLLIGSNVFASESVIQKVDRSAQEAVDEAKKAGSVIVKKLQKNTNESDKDKKSEEDSKKKDQ